MTDDSTSADKLQGGNRAAFEELFRRHYPDLVAFATRLTGASDVAEEIVQDVFLSVWRHRERGDAIPDSIAAYLFGAVRKTATSYLRHAHVEKRWRDRVISGEDITIITPSPATDSQTRFNEVIAAVRVAVDELPPRCRQAFLLRRQHGLSYAEIAQVMGIAPKTVEVQIGAALRTLRARLARFYD
jgi:RNA polymerase sigma-70 factor (ECF subfamily)